MPAAFENLAFYWSGLLHVGLFLDVCYVGFLASLDYQLYLSTACFLSPLGTCDPRDRSMFFSFRAHVGVFLLESSTFLT